MTRGDTAFDSAVEVNSLAVRGATIAAGVATSDGQTYNGNVTLGGNIALSDAGSGIVFLGTVTGTPYTLVVFGSNSKFEGAVSVGALQVGAATLDANITTTSGQSYGGAISIGRNITLTDGGGIAFDGNSNLATSFALTAVSAGNITVAGTLENSGTGAMTLVAGWDGVTPAGTAASTAGAFGLNGGSVTIGGAGAAGNAAFGSAGGTTTIAAANLTMTGTQRLRAARLCRRRRHRQHRRHAHRQSRR